ncbi:MAG: phosphoribosyltransferase family protein [Patescibacteria group bacterium]
MIRIGWKKYEQDARKLARRIPVKPNIIVAISRGGLVVGCLLSHILNKPLAVVAVQSYKGKKRGKCSMGSFSSAIPLAGTILLVDDLVDSGKSMAEVKKCLLRLPKVKRVLSAVLYGKLTSAFNPDYYVKMMTGWVQFPYEK